MNSLTVSQGSHAGMTMLSNRFIDEYMEEANDAQMKVYLYLLRCAGTDLPTGISAIADHFNYTEKDICRALQYWDKKDVISLLYDDTQKLVGIRLENLDAKSAGVISVSASSVMPPALAPAVSFAVTEPITDAPVYDKSVITLDKIKAFRQQEETSELVFTSFGIKFKGNCPTGRFCRISQI